MLSYPWIMLDGLIAHVVFEALLGDLWHAIPLREPLPLLDWYPLPFAKAEFATPNGGDFFYHASCSRFEHSETYGTTLHKAVMPENLAHLMDPKKTYDRVRGEFKAYAMEMRCNPSQYCDFYCLGDRKALEHWGNMILGLGKKRAVGFGKVVNIEIMGALEDYSITHFDQINRPIPIGFNPTWDKPKALLAYKPPYWAKINHQLCYAPGGFA